VTNSKTVWKKWHLALPSIRLEVLRKTKKKYQVIVASFMAVI